MGNMRDDVVRSSMKLFAEKVAPRVRAETAALFAKEYPRLEPA